MEREQLVSKINEALERMEKRGHGKTEGYKNLLHKRDAMLTGCEYSTRNIAPELIASMGALICNASHASFGGKIYTSEEMSKGAIEAVNEMRDNSGERD